MANKTYYILPNNPKTSKNDLEFIYYRDIIKQVMVNHNAKYTTNMDSADVCILLDYAVTNESYIATRSIPVWGRTGVASVTTTSYTTGSANSYGYGSAYSTGNTVFANANVHTSGSATTTSTQNYDYNYGVTGYKQESYRVEQFLRVLNLYAYDNKIRDDEPIMLWKTSVYSDGASDDLQYIFPYLAHASMFYIGKTTKGKEVHYACYNDPDVVLMSQNFYLNENLCVNPDYRVVNNRNMTMRSIFIENRGTMLMLLADPPVNFVKFSDNTYIEYQGQKIYLKEVKVFFHPDYSNESNYLNCSVYRQEYTPTCFFLWFPIEIAPGESFDFYSYYDRRNKKPYVIYKDISYKK
jgi:hypothetical protein